MSPGIWSSFLASIYCFKQKKSIYFFKQKTSLPPAAPPPQIGGDLKKKERENKAILTLSCLIIERTLVLSLYLVKGAGRILTSDANGVLGA